MIIKIYTDRMAEIIVEEAAEVPDAMDVVRAMTMNGIVAAKIVKTQTAQEKPVTAGFVTQQVAGSHTTIKET